MNFFLITYLSYLSLSLSLTHSLFYFHLISLFAHAVQSIANKLFPITKQKMGINRFSLLLVDKASKEKKTREREREKKELY